MSFYWSATKLNAANYCRMRYWLRYVKGEPELRLSSYVKGSLLHELIENFWKSLGNIEQVEADRRCSKKKASEKKHYFDAESFVHYAQTKWKSIIFADDALKDKFYNSTDEEKAKLEPDLISWTHDSEKWMILNTLPRYCTPLFNFLLREGKTISIDGRSLQEVPFEFEAFGERFAGRIDEIRVNPDGKIIIRDYKSGSPWIDDIKLDFDPQLTLYNPGFLSVCFNDDRLCKAVGLERRLVQDNFKNGVFVNPEIEEQFFMIEALGIDPNKCRTLPPVICPTKRTEEHFYGLLAMVKGVKRILNPPDEVYGEWGRKCSGCGMRVACRRRFNEIGHEFKDKKGNSFFSFSKPFYVRERETIIKEIEKKKKKKGYRDAHQGMFRFQWKSSDYVSGQSSK